MADLGIDASGTADCCGVRGRGSPPGRRTPTASLGQSSRRVKDRAMRPPVSGVLATALRPAGGGGVLRRPQMASPLCPSRRKQPAHALSRTALTFRNALVLEYLPLSVAERFCEAVAVASAAAGRHVPDGGGRGSDSGRPGGTGAALPAEEKASLQPPISAASSPEWDYPSKPGRCC